MRSALEHLAIELQWETDFDWNQKDARSLDRNFGFRKQHRLAALFLCLIPAVIGRTC